MGEEGITGAQTELCEDVSSDTSTPCKIGEDEEDYQVLVVHSSGMCWYLSSWLGDEVDGVAPAAIIVASIKIHDFL